MVCLKSLPDTRQPQPAPCSGGAILKGGLANSFWIHLQYHQPHPPPGRKSHTSRTSQAIDYHHLQFPTMAEADISGHYEVLEELGRMFSPWFPRCSLVDPISFPEGMQLTQVPPPQVAVLVWSTKALRGLLARRLPSNMCATIQLSLILLMAIQLETDHVTRSISNQAMTISKRFSRRSPFSAPAPALSLLSTRPAS